MMTQLPAGMRMSQLKSESEAMRRVEAPWLGESFLLSRPQCAVVNVLMTRWISGEIPDVSEESLLRRSRANCETLADLFAGNPAWGALVVPGLRPGTYRLGGPNE